MTYKITGALATVMAAGICFASGAARADNLLGFYAGIGSGESTVRSDDQYGSGYDHYDSDHHAAWKAIIGIRPMPLLGAEVEYIDFGHPSGDNNYYYDDNYYYGPDSHPRALALFGVGHLPLPIPFIDLYGKAGAARLHTNVNGFDGANCTAFSYSYNACPYNASTPSESRWDTRFAYGAGLQSRFWAGLAVRVEYERISSPYGDPDLFSVGATWTF